MIIIHGVRSRSEQVKLDTNFKQIFNKIEAKEKHYLIWFMHWIGEDCAGQDQDIVEHGEGSLADDAAAVVALAFEDLLFTEGSGFEPPIESEEVLRIIDGSGGGLPTSTTTTSTSTSTTSTSTTTTTTSSINYFEHQHHRDKHHHHHGHHRHHHHHHHHDDHNDDDFSREKFHFNWKSKS